MVHAFRLAIVLFGLWMLLSGYYLALLLFLGLISTVVAASIALRMEIVDHETYPVQALWIISTYWPWLMWEIVKANVHVSRLILTPALPISPRIIRVRASQRTELAVVTYANSITLTPGTVSIDVVDNTIEVHALSEETARELESGEMDRRVSRLERGG